MHFLGNVRRLLISIHALLAESDKKSRKFWALPPVISIHALLAESDPVKKEITILTIAISIHALLAESDRGQLPTPEPPRVFLSTLSLRRATHFIKLDVSYNIISIHALLAESDGGFVVGSWPRGIFLSTLSLRRATLEILLPCFVINNFYPRSPCGERQY